jgi:hypothetical protein
MSTQSDWANKLVGYGYSLFPIAPGKKRDAIVRWKTESTTSLTDVRMWWSEFPDDNIGINTGQSGLLVVDLDSDEALTTWDEVWDEQEEDAWDQGDFPIVETPRGWHIYMDAGKYRLQNTTGKLGEGIDTRGWGGMVVGPGSTVGDYAYILHRGHLDRVAPVPWWLGRKLREQQTLSLVNRRRTTRFRPPSPYIAARDLERWCSRIINAADGEQNTTINAAAFILARDYCPPLDIEDVRHELEQAAMEGHHPYARAARTIESGLGLGRDA